MNKYSILFKNENFLDFLSKLEEVSKIDDILKIKIDKESILVYSTEGTGAVLALKSFLLKTEDYIIGYNHEFLTNFVVLQSSKLIKNLKIFNIDIKIDIEGRLIEDENIFEVRNTKFSSGKIKIQWIGGEQIKIRDISIKSLSDRLNIKNKKWSFSCSNDDFNTIKRISTLNSSSNPDDKLITVNVKDGDVFFLEKMKWEVQVDQISLKESTIVFNKKYISYININNDYESIDFHVFETFLLIRGKDSNLMLAFEQNFE